MTPATADKPNTIAKRLTWSFESDVNLLAYKNVHTVCEESRCPNRHECSSLGIATFLIGGRECTRACKFCHIATAKPVPLTAIAEKEHDDILRTAIAGKYKYLVITSVARDDDEAGLAAHFAHITRSLNAQGITVELLVPDFHGRREHLAQIAEARPAVIAHNMETVRRLSPAIRPQADYDRSLNFFRFFEKEYPQIIRKSAFMVGLGEEINEIQTLLDDMKAAAIDIVSIGQYLRPSHDQAPVVRNYSSDEFAQLTAEVGHRGFLAAEVGPFVRSSYMAEATIAKVDAERLKRRHG
ncbi:MAG: lipoyl synthase [Spirochaetes bacterium]|nr:lipoyl synthase [Spirochaetota bacterium]